MERPRANKTLLIPDKHANWHGARKGFTHKQNSAYCTHRDGKRSFPHASSRPLLTSARSPQPLIILPSATSVSITTPRSKKQTNLRSKKIVTRQYHTAPIPSGPSRVSLFWRPALELHSRRCRGVRAGPSPRRHPLPPGRRRVRRPSPARALRGGSVVYPPDPDPATPPPLLSAAARARQRGLRRRRRRR